MIPAQRNEEDETTVEFNIDNIVTQEDIDAIDREECTEEELALLDSVQAELDTVNAPPMS